MIPARLGFALVCLLAGLALPAHAAPPADPAASRLKELVDTQKKLFATAESAGDDADLDALREQLQQLATRYDQLLKDHPDFAPAYVAYGLMLGKAGMNKESAAMLLRANQLNPDLPIVKNQLGNYLAEDGRPLDAINYYLAAIKLAPEEPLYHFQLGRLLLEARDDFLKTPHWTRATLDETMQHAFERATTLAPDDWRYAYHYGLSFYELETREWEAALQFWRSFETRLKPGVEQQVCRLHQAKILHELRRTDEARKLLATVTESTLSAEREKIATALDQPPQSHTPPPAPQQ